MSKGKDSDEPIDIVLLDVKTGSAGLNAIQRKIEEAAASKRVSFDVLRIVDQTVPATFPAVTQTQLKLGTTEK